ncbi:MAG TPA: hypothetical protein VGY99_05195, partial [Candidatus Binataceae bacterium]|nr:hypothetical protein [Candidatus Binataceae bacterium]
MVMVFDSQTKTICLILQDQRGTQTFLMPNSGERDLPNVRSLLDTLAAHFGGRARKMPAPAARTTANL